MVSILQLLLFSELLSISQIDVYCQEEAANVPSLMTKKSLDSGDGHHPENRINFQKYADQAMPKVLELFNPQVNTDMNGINNLRASWNKLKSKNKLGRERGFRIMRPIKEAIKWKQNAKQMMQAHVPRRTLSQTSFTFDTSAVKASGRRTKPKKCHDSNEEEHIELSSAGECNCSIGSKILREIRQLKNQLDCIENLVNDNFNLDDDL